MNRHRRSSLLVVLAATLVAAGCSVVPEQKILQDFFRASRLSDPGLASFATAAFDPRSQGTVQSFDIVEVTPEQGTPAPLKELSDALDEALAAEEAFSREKMAYQTGNLPAIERVVKAERLKETVARRDLPVQEAWARWRTESAQHAKAVSDARAKLRAARGIFELSLSRPNGPAPDVTRMEGELVEKDVTVNANVRTPEGESVQKTLVVTLARAVMRDGDQEPVPGRWIVRRVREQGAAPPT